MVKRSLLPTLVIGVLVSGLILALHQSGLALRPEMALTAFVSRDQSATGLVSDKWQLLLVPLLAFAVGWMALESPRRKRLGWLIAALILELSALAWVLALYRIFFQPLPAALAVVFAFVLAISWRALVRHRRSLSAAYLFANRLSAERIADLDSADMPEEGVAKSFEATAVVCDIANKHDLAEEMDAAAFAGMSERFIERTTDHFLEAGAYIESADGEGVVALFGFPTKDAEQAERATRHALKLVQSFAQLRANGQSDLFGRLDVHVGVSSGQMIISRPETEERTGLLATGEPVELARRFCIANRVYGSRVLIGPRTFELSNTAIIARPIDFLSGGDERDRHEIYEPVSLAVNATSEEIKRRDSFWNGVVLYREKRWGEAYSQFRAARAADKADDLPLELYLRRLEPLVLHLTSDDRGQ